MKRIIQCILLIIISSTSTKCFSQTEWYGRWSVNCTVRGIEEHKPTCCRICPVKGTMADYSYTVSGFIFFITKDSIEIKMPSRSSDETIPYVWDEKKKNIIFTYQKDKYTFHTSIANRDTMMTDKETNAQYKVERRDTTFIDEMGQSLFLQKR